MSTSLPGNYDLTIYRGDTFDMDFIYATVTATDGSGNPTEWTVINMTGGTLLAEIRQTTVYGSTLLETFTIANFVPTSGSFSIQLAPSATNGVSWTQGFYDIQFTDSNGNVSTLCYGTVTIMDDVSYSS